MKGGKEHGLLAWVDVRNFPALQRMAQSPHADAFDCAASSNEGKSALIWVRGEIGEVDGAPVAAVVECPRKLAGAGIKACVEATLP